jgi:hypothetical protein
MDWNRVEGNWKLFKGRVKELNWTPSMGPRGPVS